ncbi:ABC transporter ATP-binding protein, partial [bacterium]|nr:ABC transporter ATP-binding protein [bacterium]
MNLPFVNSFKGFTKYFLASNLKWFYFTIVLGFISMGVLTFRTFTFKFLVDALIAGSREMFVEAIWITVFVYFLGNFLRAAEDYMFVTLINKPSYRMRVFAFEYLLKQPFSYYQDKLSGKILGDYYSLRKCFTIFGRLYKQYMKILEMVIVAGIAFWVSAYIGILFLAFGCVVYGIYKFFN